MVGRPKNKNRENGFLKKEIKWVAPIFGSPITGRP